MSFSIGIKRNYDDISGTKTYSAAKCLKNEYHSLQKAMNVIDTATPAEVRSIAETLWNEGFLLIKAGEFSISFELCTHLNYDRLRKILCVTDESVRNHVTKFSLLHYLHLGAEIPALLIEAFPFLDISELKECHSQLPDHLFYVGKERVQITANKGVLGFRSSDTSSSSCIEDVCPLDFQNCLRVTVGQMPHFITKNHMQEFVQLVETLSDLHLFEAPSQIINLFERFLSGFLLHHKDDILKSPELSTWLNTVTKLLDPGFKAGKLQAVRHVLVHDFYVGFCKIMKGKETLEDFKTVQDYMSLAAQEIAPSGDDENPLQMVKRYLSELLQELIHQRIFSDQPVEDDIEFSELIESSIVKTLLVDSIDKLTRHKYSEISPTRVRNLLFLLEYVQEKCMEEMPDRHILKNVIMKLVDLLQFNLRRGDREKALQLCKKYFKDFDEIHFVYVLMLRKTNPLLSKQFLQAAVESCEPAELREGFQILLAYSMFKDDGNLEGAIEYSRRHNGILFKHLHAYLLCHKQPLPYDEIERLLSKKEYCHDPLAYCCAFILGKKIPNEELNWTTPYTLMSLFISDITSQMPAEWQLKLLPTEDLNTLFNFYR
jgi:hypothetical protein